MCACVLVCESIQPLPFLSVLQAPLASHSPLSSICFTLHLCCMPYYSITPSLRLHVSLCLSLAVLSSLSVSVSLIYLFYFFLKIWFVSPGGLNWLLFSWTEWKAINCFFILMRFTACFERSLQQLKHTIFVKQSIGLLGWYVISVTY